MLQAFFQRMRRSAEMIDGTESKEKARRPISQYQLLQPFHTANESVSCENRSTCEDPLKQSPRDYSVLIESRTVIRVQARGVVGQRDGTRRNRGGSRRLDHKNKGKSLMNEIPLYRWTTVYEDRGRRVVVFELFFDRMGTNTLRLVSTRRLWQTVPRSQWQYSVGTSTSSAFSFLVATGRGSGTVLSTSIRAAATIFPLELKTRESFMEC